MQDLAALTVRDALVCRVQAELPLASLSSASAHGSRLVYRIDQRAGPIAFSVDHCGLFEASGRLGRYNAVITLDRAMPLALRVELEFDTASVALARPSQGAPSFLPRFDTAAHPKARFRSSAVVDTGAGQYLVRGLMEVAGATRLQTLNAELLGRHIDPITGTDVAELLIEHRFMGSCFGLTPGQTFLSDRIDLRIHARIEFEA